MLRKAIPLAAWILVSFLAAAIGGLASVEARSFYEALDRPPWAPPGWLFGPVWTVLYLFMGIAAWLVWKARGWQAGKGPLSLFIAQLTANALWSWIFFAWRNGALAFAEILLLWGLVLATLIRFWRVDKLAGLLLAPYLAWVSFAAGLALTLWRDNPHLLGK